MNWQEIFSPDVSPVEIFVRGTVMYLFIYFTLRFVFKRESGATGITDLLVLVLLADAAQNGMAGEYTSIGDGVLLVGVIVLWATALDFLAYKVPPLRRFVRPRPLPLVRRGRLLRYNLAKELLTDDELFSQLREQGITRLSQVRQAQMEPDGRLSIVRFDEQGAGWRGHQDRMV
ncbi:Protein of unknown function [Amycolatopsis arida]|uniref:YetF C-terminal domain-containing protein n=1 Tax=Amycolatopsis arida TaxID=587909 RepID=A0A1I5YWS2_9PSEU|nr:YetF domain-containing protein [Amycolatopsis arida]TDX89949.1 uncharacterized protein DUF421 [Amycolatopsis arida]SFQ48723.1 Protein of unknown function [Amycolatopsis arida]